MSDRTIISIDPIWDRIQKNEGKPFTTKTGISFVYDIDGNAVLPRGRNRQLPKSDFAKALELVPLYGPSEIHHLQGPSYIYAILMDPRIRRTDW